LIKQERGTMVVTYNQHCIISHTPTNAIYTEWFSWCTTRGMVHRTPGWNALLKVMPILYTPFIVQVCENISGHTIVLAGLLRPSRTTHNRPFIYFIPAKEINPKIQYSYWLFSILNNVRNIVRISGKEVFSIAINGQTNSAGFHEFLYAFKQNVLGPYLKSLTVVLFCEWNFFQTCQYENEYRVMINIAGWTIHWK
jgi:hypothetical protein